jgi:hypothetical protein
VSHLNLHDSCFLILNLKSTFLIIFSCAHILSHVFIYIDNRRSLDWQPNLQDLLVHTTLNQTSQITVTHWLVSSVKLLLTLEITWPTTSCESSNFLAWLLNSTVEGRSYFTTDGQSVSMSWYRAPLWDLRPDITSCRNVAV